MLSRRNFIKYASAGLAAAAVGGGYYYYQSQEQKGPYTTTPTSATTEITTSSSTTGSSTTSETSTGNKYSIKGKVVNDKNGNGKQDMDEQGISKAIVQLWTNIGKNDHAIADAITDSTGSYTIDDVKEEIYGVYILPPGAKYEWWCISRNEILTTRTSKMEFGNFIRNHYVLDLRNLKDEDEKNNPDKFDIGLMEGFATKPYEKGGDSIRYHVDVDPRPGKIRDWSGGTATYDGHNGTDTIEGQDTPICAIAPGIVIEAEEKDSSTPKSEHPLKMKGKYVMIDHGNGYISYYGHLSSLKVKPRELTLDSSDKSLQKVKRGEIIGYEGMSGGTSSAHLHLGIQKYVSKVHYYGLGLCIDPFRNLNEDLDYGGEFDWGQCDSCFSNNISLWTEDNKPYNPGI